MMYNFVRNDLKNNWRKQICKWNLFILDKIGKTLSMFEGFSSEHVEDENVVLLCKCLDVLKFEYDKIVEYKKRKLVKNWNHL